jgi:hypothetical protein
MTLTEIGALVGSTTGIAALVLGILNYRLQHRNYILQHRAQESRVKVDLVHVEMRGDTLVAIPGDLNLLLPCAVYVYNESNFDVTIAEVGVRVRQPQQATLSPGSPMTIDGFPLPHRLAPRQGCSVPLGNEHAWNLASRDVETVFAKLDSGVEFRINSSRLSVLKTLGPIIRKVRDEKRRETT